MQISCAVTADQRHCSSTIPLLPKSEIQASSHLPSLYSSVCVGLLVGNPDNRFSHEAAHIMGTVYNLMVKSLLNTFYLHFVSLEARHTWAIETNFGFGEINPFQLLIMQTVFDSPSSYRTNG